MSTVLRASQVALVVKDLPANAGDMRDLHGEDPLGGGHGNPLQCSCLENPCGQRSLVQRVARSRTQLNYSTTLV